MAQMVKNPTAMQETWVRSLGWEDPLEDGMATHSSILAWTEEPGRLQSKESDTAERLSTVQHNDKTGETFTLLGSTLLWRKIGNKIDNLKHNNFCQTST